VSILQAAVEQLPLLAAALPGQALSPETLVAPTWTLYVATGINALSGAAFAARRGFDFVGVIGLALAQGLGGLMLMSILLRLGIPFVLTDAVYIMVALAAGLAGFFFAAQISQALRFALVIDALAMGLFVSIGAGSSLLVALNPISAVFVGVITAIGGLILRDVLAGSAPMVLRPGVLVGVVALAGSLLFIALVEVAGTTIAQAQGVTVLFVTVLRTLAVLLNWRTGEATKLADRLGSYREGRR